jgi:hypothetical protein
MQESLKISLSEKKSEVKNYDEKLDLLARSL